MNKNSKNMNLAERIISLSKNRAISGNTMFQMSFLTNATGPDSKHENRSNSLM